MRTWRHVNDTIRYKGLSSSQLGLVVLLPFTGFIINLYLAPIISLAVLIIWRWYFHLQRKGDQFPIRTQQIIRESPSLIQDNYGYIEILIDDED